MLATPREPVLPDDAPHVNPNGGAIAMGHPPGMTGSASSQVPSVGLMGGVAVMVCAPCVVGMGQGIAPIIQRVRHFLRKWTRRQ